MHILFKYIWIFFRVDHILDHKTSLNKFKRIELFQAFFPHHNIMKIEINYRNKNRKRTNNGKLNNILLKIQCINEEMKEEIRKYLETNKNRNKTLQGFPWWSSGNESTSQCRRCGFDPWSGN